MTNMLATVIPKSDQINADDLIGKTMTIKVTKFSLLAGEQPVAISYEGDGGKPYKPCKSMRRVLIQVWGTDGNSYVGRSMTIFRDEKVTFGGTNVGGIRISHMSHIDAPVTMALTVSRTNRRPFTVQPLVVIEEKKAPEEDFKAAKLALEMVTTQKTLDSWQKDFGDNIKSDFSKGQKKEIMDIFKKIKEALEKEEKEPKDEHTIISMG